MKALGVLTLTLALLGAANAADPEKEAYLPAQAAADVIREVAGADIAFLPAAVLKRVDNPTDLSQLMLYSSDQVSVVALSGKQVRDALTRSISLYPTPSGGFLQLSGVEASFTPSNTGENKIVKVMVGENPLDEKATYKVAMPSSLARGSLGYLKIWDRGQIERTLTDRTLDEILRGKRMVNTTPRWTLVQG